VGRPHQHSSAALYFKNSAIQRRVAIEEYDHKKPATADDPGFAATQVGTIIRKFVGGLGTLKHCLLLNDAS
jgi:hypothetical protein